jgi:anaerobic selenocysteine-containing dehydrogenase
MVQIREPVPPVFNTRHADDIYTELAERVGILYGDGGLYDCLNKNIDRLSREHGMNLTEEHKLDINKKHSLEEIFEQRFKSWPYNKDGWELDQLKQTGFLEVRVPRKEFYNYYHVPGNQTRHPFYFEHLKAVGDELRANLRKHNIKFPGIDNEEHIFEMYRPIPHWVENSESRAPEQFDLWAINWRTPYFASDASNVSGNPWLAELTAKDPYEAVVCMNSTTAERKHFKNGDTVVVESRYGKIEGEDTARLRGRCAPPSSSTRMRWAYQGAMVWGPYNPPH